jgi:hypothetical protein
MPISFLNMFSLLLDEGVALDYTWVKSMEVKITQNIDITTLFI